MRRAARNTLPDRSASARTVHCAHLAPGIEKLEFHAERQTQHVACLLYTSVRRCSRRSVVRFLLWRSGVWGPWERLRTPMPVPHRVRVQATVCGSGQSSCDSNVFESVFRMKWLRRAIPSAANLGPDTDSSFHSREPPFFRRGCTFRLFGAAFTRCRFVVLGMWSLPYPGPVYHSGSVRASFPVRLRG